MNKGNLKRNSFKKGGGDKKGEKGKKKLKLDLTDKNTILKLKMKKNKREYLPEKKVKTAETDNATNLTEDQQSEEEIDLDFEDLPQNDPFMVQLQNELSPGLLATVSHKPPLVERVKTAWPVLGNMIFTQPKVEEETEEKKQGILETQVFASTRPLPQIGGEFSLNKIFIKSQILDNVIKANEKYNKQEFSDLQKELLTIASSYQDIYFPERNFTNGEEIRFAYCTHAINHVLKTRLKVIHHNAKLQKKGMGEVPEEFRDQGLVRPKVLILLPFKDSALRIVKMMISILLGESGNVMNKKRFLEEYGGNELAMPKKNPKPTDYQLLFSGNVDDSFKIGISVTKKCLKLYADFYNSDIILASPLGLRILIGAEGEQKRDYDFLASIEVLIMDQAHVFYMQNWEHVLHLMDHLHLQPKEAHGTDLSRVRMWSLNGWSRYYRQNMVFSSHPLPEITAMFNTKCHNYAGKVVIANPVISGTIRQVILQVPQVFHFVNATSVSDAIDVRFDSFTNSILPQFKDPTMKHTLIYVPSYFDYVRIRNYFKKHDISFVQICEYSKDGKVAKARDIFFHGQTHFMLYSERFHFFRRIRLRGIRHIIFYQPPAIPGFYSEMCNLMQDLKNEIQTEGLSDMSVNVIYSKFDATQLAAIVDSERATRMLASDKPVHMFMTDT